MAVVLPFLALTAGGALVVQRAPDAVDCPDAPVLSAMIERLTSKAPEPADVAPASAERFDVEFSRGPGRYRVVLRIRGSHAGMRTLNDAGSTCASLADATALTIAVIIDPEGVKLAEPNPPPEAPPPPPPPPPLVEKMTPPDESAPASPTARWALAVDARAGAAIGVVRSAAPTGTLAIELRPASLVSIDAGVLFVPTQSLALERGSVDVWLLAGAANACVWPYAEAVRVGACVGLLAGTVHAEGRGYPIDAGASRPWLAASAAVAGGGPIAWRLGWTARAGVVVPSPCSSARAERRTPDVTSAMRTRPRADVTAAAGSRSRTPRLARSSTAARTTGRPRAARTAPCTTASRSSTRGRSRAAGR